MYLVVPFLKVVETLLYNYSLWWVDLGQPTKLHYHFLSSTEQGENTMEKLIGRDKNKEITY